MFRKTTLILALTMAGTAQANCYVRSAVTNQTTMSITAVADIDPFVVPISPTQNKCIVMFRAQVNGEWITVEGERIGPRSMSERELCAGAVDSGRIQILSRANGGNMAVEQNMVCTDQPEIKVKSVKRGEIVRESEVRPHPHFPKSFAYRTAQCRWFIEPEVHPGRDLLQRQGIICQVNGNEWQVVDKW
jgi:hypothetical protein